MLLVGISEHCHKILENVFPLRYHLTYYDIKMTSLLFSQLVKKMTVGVVNWELGIVMHVLQHTC